MEPTPPTPPSASPDMPRKAFIFLVITGFLTAIGFGIINPVAPFLVSRYVNDPNSVGVVLGWLSAIYALCAFFTAPGLGALSDRFGRRPILLICLLGSAVGYLFFGIGSALWVLFLGRIIDGLTGGNQGVLFAYVADQVPAGQRGKFFGLLGAIIGIGFILGPTLGGLLAKFSLSDPFYLAAAVTFANVIFGLFFMPESLAKEKRVEHVSIAALNPFSILQSVFSLPQIRALLIAIFLYSLPFAALQVTLGLFAKDSLNWTPDAIGLNFAVVGITDIIVQGLLLRWLSQRLSESRIAVIGLCCVAIGYLLIASIALLHSPVPLVVGTIIFAAGDGLFGPTFSGLLSHAADERSQGTVQGGSQSVQSLARIFGPLLGGAMYVGLGTMSPFLAGTVISLFAAGAIGVASTALNRRAPANEELPTPTA